MPDPQPPQATQVPALTFLSTALIQGWGALVITRPAPWLGAGFIQHAQICRHMLPANFANFNPRQQELALATVWAVVDARAGRLPTNKWLPTVRTPLTVGRESRVESREPIESVPMLRAWFAKWAKQARHAWQLYVAAPHEEPPMK